MQATYIQDFTEWSKDFSFATSLTVPFSDLDLYGIVNNAVTISYLEYARIEYFKHLDLMSDWLNPNCSKAIVLADVQCDYIKPIHFDEGIKIQVKVARLGTSSIDMHYLGKDEQEEVVFTGRSTVVQIDKRTGKSSPWSEEMRLKFSLN